MKSKSLTKYILFGICISLISLFTAIATSNIWAWVCFAFSCFIPIFFWYSSISSKSKIRNKIEQYEGIKNQNLEHLLNSNKYFYFKNDSFTIKHKTEEVEIIWDNVQAIFVYKIDNYTTDTIIMDIFFEDIKKITISEDTSGWFQFIDNLESALPNINKSWIENISTPAFKTNLTLIYSRENETLSQAEKKYYNS